MSALACLALACSDDDSSAPQAQTNNAGQAGAAGQAAGSAGAPLAGGAGSAGVAGQDPGGSGGSAGQATGGNQAGGAAGSTSSPTVVPFSAFCTAKLLKDTEGMHTDYGGAWYGLSSDPINLPAGTSFMLGSETSLSSPDGILHGYLFLPSGEPSKIQEDSFFDGLIKGKDFESSCPTSAKAKGVLLTDSNFYGTPELTGEPCSLKAGTLVDGSFFTHSNTGGKPTSLLEYSQGLKALCGFSEGYSTDAVHVSLLLPLHPRARPRREPRCPR